MKLSLERNQRSATLGRGKPFFSLTARAEVTDAEEAAINRHRLADEILYVDGDIPEHGPDSLASTIYVAVRSLNLGTLTVRDLVKGKTLEHKELGELLAAEDQIRKAAHNLKLFIDVAESFGGREVVEL